MRFAMQPTGPFILVSFCFCALTAGAADATSPVDATQRNTSFSPASTAPITPEKQRPKDKANETMQEKRFEKNTIERKTSPLGDRRAPIELTETREKQVRDKDSHRPEAIERKTSAFDHRQSAISTGAATTKPPTVAKYQDSLTSASASNMARFPAMDRATNAKINRFVFQKNPAEAAGALDGKTVTPAAGGSVIQK
ncbi:MAG: hypothetical protein EXS37_18730 [Opitutus sp.]|nr:hypothetical protein [Opitutus sp.]